MENSKEFPQKTKAELPYDPAIPLLDIYMEKTIIWKDTCTPIFTAALFTRAKTWKQPKCPWTDEWIQMWHLYANQEEMVRIRHGTTDWFQTGIRVRQGCILSPCLFNSYAEYIRWNAGLDDAQARIKIADDTTLIAESEEVKSLLIKVKEETEKASLKLNIPKTKIMASSSITSWQIDGETRETVTDFLFLGSKITADVDYSQEIKRCLLLGRKAMTNLDCILKSRDITLLTNSV